MVVLELVALIVGIAIISYSSEKTVEFSTHIAAAFKVPTLVVGLFLVSFGTDIPEIANSIVSSYTGHGDINVGDTLGSCLTQISLVLGLVAIFGGVVKGKRRNIIVLGLCAVAAVLVASLVVSDGELSRIDATALVLTYVFLLAISIRNSEKTLGPQKADIFCVGTSRSRCMTFLFISVIGVIIGAAVVVNSVISISESIGLPEYFLSFFIVGIGTSLPELSVELAAIRKKQYGIVVGDVMGSNITDATLALGIGPLLFPNLVSADIIFPLATYVILASAIIVAIFAWREKIDKKAAGVLLLIYLLSFLFAL